MCFVPCTHVIGDETNMDIDMPAHWKVVSDYYASKQQVEVIGNRLDARLSSVRNILYDVDGKRVQLNVITTPDAENSERLMVKLRSMKAEEALLKKGLIVYEFVGPNDVLDLIAEGRQHIDAM